uniref:Ig-like domain-containing protein n=1 Tax=Glossina brevipalpis TaxID=37001 RepID=A0A1A9WUQ8_9MUSC
MLYNHCASARNCANYTFSLRLIEVRIPSYVIKDSMAQLECLYDLDGEALYSVKWYKDGNEFYRYVPKDIPPAQTFHLPGISVDVYSSNDAIVTLRDVNLQTSGRFRCEISGEAPYFQTITQHGDMVVVSLPDQGPPKITGGSPRYQIGDWVHVNCTSGRSKPPVQLSWLVNGQAAEPQSLRKYKTIISGRDDLETSVLGLQFRVARHHFRNGDMKLKCVASLSTFYWRSNEESVESDRAASESRTTFYVNNTRADPVQDISLKENSVTKILSYFIQQNAANSTNSKLLLRSSNLIILLLTSLITMCRCFENMLTLKQNCTLLVTNYEKIDDTKKLSTCHYEQVYDSLSQEINNNAEDNQQTEFNKKVLVISLP